MHQPDPSQERRPLQPILRAARPDDAERLTAIANMPEIRAGTLRPPFGRVEDTRRGLENGNADRLHIVAVLDDLVVGNAGLDRLGGRRRHDGRRRPCRTQGRHGAARCADRSRRRLAGHSPHRT